jgi:hypothetical protein
MIQVFVIAVVTGLYSLVSYGDFSRAFSMMGIILVIGLIWKMLSSEIGGSFLTVLLMIFGVGWLFGGDDDDDE